MSDNKPATPQSQDNTQKAPADQGKCFDEKFHEKAINCSKIVKYNVADGHTYIRRHGP